MSACAALRSFTHYVLVLQQFETRCLRWALTPKQYPFSFMTVFFYIGCAFNSMAHLPGGRRRPLVLSPPKTRTKKAPIPPRGHQRQCTSSGVVGCGHGYWQSTRPRKRRSRNDRKQRSVHADTESTTVTDLEDDRNSCTHSFGCATTAVDMKNCTGARLNATTALAATSPHLGACDAVSAAASFANLPLAPRQALTWVLVMQLPPLPVLLMPRHPLRPALVWVFLLSPSQLPMTPILRSAPRPF